MIGDSVTSTQEYVRISTKALPLGRVVVIQYNGL